MSEQSKITPAMMRAGCEEMRIAEPYDPRSCLVESIYRSMEAERTPDQIEITPEMIALGAGELMALPVGEIAEGYYPAEDAVELIYRAMRTAEHGMSVRAAG